MLATRLGIRPVFPMRSDLRHVSDSRDFHFDTHAIQLYTIMGTGWQVMAESHPKIVDLALRAVELTSAVDQSYRVGRNCLQFSQLTLLVTVFQHDLYDLAFRAETSDLVAADLSCIFQISCLSLQIYSDVVLFPAPESSAVRQRLAEQLRQALTLYQSRERSEADDRDRKLVRWATVMGAVASESTSYRDWYLRQIKNMIVNDNLTRESLKDSLVSFLWWEYAFEEHVLDIWDDALISTAEKRVFTVRAVADVSQCA